MNNLTEQAESALVQSILHWRRVVASPDEKVGGRECALCAEFNNFQDRSDACAECPIMQDTGKQYCYNTPFWDYDNSVTAGVLEETRVTLAQNELDYLENLLEKRTNNA